jgi:predicted anti-sigma-YlaC factor YlaD
VRPVHADCERARQWTSIALDGELSAFERFLLDAHLDGCAECRAFNSDVGQFTSALRDAPAEPFAGVQLNVRPRRARLAFAPAVAAMAVAAVALGSVVASSHLGSGFEHGTAAPQPAAALVGLSHDAMNLHTLRVLQQLDVTKAISSRAGGGPFVQDR